MHIKLHFVILNIYLRFNSEEYDVTIICVIGFVWLLAWMSTQDKKRNKPNTDEPFPLRKV